jgi:MFS family permease
MVIGDHIAYEGIFYLLAAMCAATIVAARFIRPGEIDHDLARGAAGADEPLEARDGCEREGPRTEVPGGAAPGSRVAGLGELFGDRRILVFSAAVVLFHFANAAMLPLAGQKLSHGHDRGAAGCMSACIIAAQLVMVPVALLASRLAVSWGRRPVFLAGFAVLPVRGVLYTMTSSPYALVAIQLLDGIGAGIFGVVGTLVIADLTLGTGRFNLMQGALATATGIGAALSNLMTGFVVEAGGYDAGFLVLAAIAAAALVFYGLVMPETRVESHEVSESSARSRRRSAMAMEQAS